MRTAAVLPVKRFARAKQRLGASIEDDLRLELAQAMVSDVLDALAGADAVTLTIVVTAEEKAAALARAHGALVLEDRVEDGQSAAAALGIREAVAEGIERVLCVPGDCPTLAPAELESLLHPRHADREVVIVPDRHGTGTNGLLLRPPGVIAPAFGPGSCARHRALARAAGVACRVERIESLLLDVDTGADLAALHERVAESLTGASHTRAVLERRERPPTVPIDTAA